MKQDNNKKKNKILWQKIIRVMVGMSDEQRGC